MFKAQTKGNFLDINAIIKEILIQRDGVVIPGLGSFVSKYQSARINFKNNVIHPPSKEIHFNPRITTDSDQVLAGYIASREDTTISTAQSKIKGFVQTIKNQIASKGEYNLPGIGTIKKGDQGEIEFTPEEDPIYNLGFEEIKAEPFELEKLKETTERMTHSAPPPPPPPPRPRKSGRKTILWISLIIIFLIIAGGGYYIGFFDYLAYKIKDQEILKQIYNPAKQEQIKGKSSTLPDDTALDTVSVSPEIRQAINRMTDKKRALMYREPEDSKTYHIIAGSFQIRKNALQYKDQLSQKGYKAKILENDSLFRISVKSYDNKEDALVELYRMRDGGALKSIWLLGVQEKDR